MKKIKILEVNNEDLIGRRFNGYDMVEYFANDKTLEVKQLVIYKRSTNDHVSTLIQKKDYELLSKLQELERLILSTKGQISLTTPFLHEHKWYQEADIIHFHQYHNSLFSIYDLIKIAKEKKVVISLHDPWWLSGKCVHSEGCDKWKKGCNHCPHLENTFPMLKDNTESLWNLKKQVLKGSGITFLYPSTYIGSLVRESEILKEEKSIFLSFGIDTTIFYPKDKEICRKKFKIPKKNKVISLRAQNEFKGTNYVIEALRKMENIKNLTIITCDQTGLLDEFKNKCQIIDLGVCKDTEILSNMYNASDVFLSPSLGEAFGFMPIEAMACGTVSIVFDNTALPGVTFAPEVGILARDKDSDDLKEKIEWALHNPKELEKRSVLGLEKVRKYYSLDVYYKKLKEIYLCISKESKGKNRKVQVKHATKQEINTLNKKLRKIYKEAFLEKCKSGEFKTTGLLNRTVDIISYDTIEVQEKLTCFNEFLCDKVKTEYNEKRTPIRTFLRLLVHDRKKLVETVKEKLQGRH